MAFGAASFFNPDDAIQKPTKVVSRTPRSGDLQVTELRCSHRLEAAALIMSGLPGRCITEARRPGDRRSLIQRP